MILTKMEIVSQNCKNNTVLEHKAHTAKASHQRRKPTPYGSPSSQPAKAWRRLEHCLSHNQVEWLVLMGACYSGLWWEIVYKCSRFSQSLFQDHRKDIVTTLKLVIIAQDEAFLPFVYCSPRLCKPSCRQSNAQQHSRCKSKSLRGYTTVSCSAARQSCLLIQIIDSEY